MKRIRPGYSKIAVKQPINWVRLRDRLGNGAARPRLDPFTVNPDLHPPAARPPASQQMAQDSALCASGAWAAAAIASSFAEGVQFLGYPYLAELAQRPEYRVISQTIAEEMTRKWLKFEAAGKNKELDKDLKRKRERQRRMSQLQGQTAGAMPAPGASPDQQPPQQTQPQARPSIPGFRDGAEAAQAAEEAEAQAQEAQEEAEAEAEKAQAEAKAEAKAERINQLEEMFKELGVKECMKLIVEQDGFFGRSHLYLDTGDTDNHDELRLSIGSGKDALSKIKVRPDKPLQRIRPVEAVWCYPTNYESIDPLKQSWYRPEHWFVMGKNIHISRLFTFVGNEVPDLLKPAYSFGGLSMTQMAQPYVNNWLQTRQSVNDLIQAFVVWGLRTNLAETLQMEGEQLFARLDLFNRLRNNRGVMVTDKETEEFHNTTAPLSGLEQLQAQSQEHMAAVSRIPLVKLLGIQPSGLNASSEGEIRVYYDTIQGRQESFLTKPLTRLMHFCMLSLWGEIDEEITLSWNPLWALDEKQKAEVDEIQARTAQIRIDTGVIDKAEERRRVAESSDTPYPGLDPDAEPDLKQEEEEGLVPKGSGAGVKAVIDPDEGGGEARPDEGGGGKGEDEEEEFEGFEHNRPLAAE